MSQWVRVCAADGIDEEDVIEFSHGARVYAVYRTTSGYYASDASCTHEEASLADGLVIDDTIECPLHQGRFHIPSGKAKSAPVCVDLMTYPAKLEDGHVFIQVPAD